MNDRFDDQEERECNDPFTKQVREMVEKEVERRMTETVKQEKHLRALVEKKSKRIDTLQREVYDAIHNRNAEIEKIKKESLNEAVKELTGGHYLGEKVYHTYNNSVRQPCSVCRATGKLDVVVDGKNYKANCPVCQGYKAVSEENYEPADGVIASMHIYPQDSWCNRARVKFTKRISGDYESDCDFKYLWSSVEECQAECNRLNEIAKEKRK